MDDLISREALLEEIGQHPEIDGNQRAAQILECILNAAAVGAAPVVHARWIWSPEYCKWICSACAGREGECETPVCKWCGARMDLPEGEEAKHESH